VKTFDDSHYELALRRVGAKGAAEAMGWTFTVVSMLPQIQARSCHQHLGGGDGIAWIFSHSLYQRKTEPSAGDNERLRQVRFINKGSFAANYDV
jgi:hypothetical protein